MLKYEEAYNRAGVLVALLLFAEGVMDSSLAFIIASLLLIILLIGLAAYKGHKNPIKKQKPKKQRR